MSIWVTADTHFGHDNIRKYCQRPFSSLDEMDYTLMENWNRVVKSGDTVYHLGDFAYGDHERVKRYRWSLKGKIILIMGNHDYKNRIKNIKGLFTEIADLKTIKYNGEKLILCHYAMRTWDSSHWNTYQLYGHSHGRMPPVGKQMDVGVDANGFQLFHIDQIMKTMLLKPDNPNYIPPEDRNRSDNSTR